ncbi:MAG: hypothetical protein ACM3MK_04755 [Chitinophagales bacterium]
MRSIEEITTTETIEWLLEKDNPSVRYLALTRLLNQPENDKEVLAAKQDIMKTGIVPEILEKQNDVCWGDPKKFYTEKYSGTVWQLIILAELGADGENEQIKKACEFILDNSQDIESFGFAMNKGGKGPGGRHSEVIPCLTGNMVYSLIKLGMLEDQRVQRGIEWICKYQRSDDGISEQPEGWPYDRLEVCWGKHTCHMGVVKSLKALSAIPSDKRNNAINERINSLTEYILTHHIHKKSHDLKSVSKPGWLKLGFPLMYQTDILEILGILTELGYHDPRMNEALEIVKNKRNTNNRWILENTFNGKMIKNIEVKGKESKWITLKALETLGRSSCFRN